MLLYPNLSNSVTIDGIEYFINTEYYIILKILEISKREDLTNEVKAIACCELFYKSKCQDIVKGIDAMWAWIKEGELKINDIGGEEQSEPVLDYFKDDQFIFASMCQSYGDVWKKWHWYEWKAAFDNLPDNSPIRQVMSIRGQKVKVGESSEEKIRIRKLKAIYALNPLAKEKTGEEILAELQERERNKNG